VTMALKDYNFDCQLKQGQIGHFIVLSCSNYWIIDAHDIKGVTNCNSVAYKKLAVLRWPIRDWRNL
jgi:hypothetical protein